MELNAGLSFGAAMAGGAVGDQGVSGPLAPDTGMRQPAT
jgi:hypothetical protein